MLVYVFWTRKNQVAKTLSGWIWEMKVDVGWLFLNFHSLSVGVHRIFCVSFRLHYHRREQLALMKVLIAMPKITSKVCQLSVSLFLFLLLSRFFFCYLAVVPCQLFNCHPPALFLISFYTKISEQKIDSKGWTDSEKTILPQKKLTEDEQCAHRQED